jgi:starvation-inducible DNA-binding protein
MTSHKKFIYFTESRKLINSTLYDSTAINARKVAGSLASLVADIYKLHFKTRGVHNVLSMRNVCTDRFRLNAQANETFLAAQLLSECVEKLGGTSHNWPIILNYLEATSSVEFTDRLPCGLLVELLEQNAELTIHMQEAKWLCDEYGDFDSAILLEDCLKEADCRVTSLARSGS